MRIYPRSPLESDLLPVLVGEIGILSTLPCGHRITFWPFRCHDFLYPRFPLRETTNQHPSGTTRTTYSIHAFPLGGERHLHERGSGAQYPISIHAPCGERRAVGDIVEFIDFLHALLLEESDSLRTGSGRGAEKFIQCLLRRTPVPLDPVSALKHFYPRSPCGERRCARFRCWVSNEFLSTLSLRRATFRRFCLLRLFVISIHALLAESDGSSFPPIE